ncbi:MAG: TatD family hydrolase [Candidatus Paceibacterota bacterium]
MNLIDSHTHPQFPQYDKDRGEMIRRTLDGGVKMICVGTDLKMSQKAVELAEKYDGIWASVGVHPNDNIEETFDPEVYKKLAGHTKVVALGEVGLDYYRTPEPDRQDKQKERLRKQILLAKELDKPLIIHCRDAHEDMMAILKDNKGLGGVIHSFTGTWEQAQRYLDLGFHLGLNGIITFADQYDETVINAPLDKILVETDAPYLTPAPYRGKRNESLYIFEVVKKIAELKKKSIEEVAQATTDNATRLFNL